LKDFLGAINKPSKYEQPPKHKKPIVFGGAIPLQPFKNKMLLQKNLMR
jgi:hypothetical protein